MRFTIERRVDATPQTVWKLISDFQLSPGHGVTVRVLEPGAADGGNMVRDITIGTMAIRERIDEVEPGKSFTYSIIKGTPTRFYKGKGEIAETADGTLIRWSGEFAPLVPFTSPLLRMIARRNVGKYLDAVLTNMNGR